MFATSATSRAKQHISHIRKDFDLRTFGASRHVTNLERALDLLSDQLYQKPTHFLLELIQNADDNEYQTGNPSVTFTLDRSRLRIDCNETGFSRENVEAICQIGQSTKTGKSGTTRYVGEKGIGFKSVFKVAEKVWISSNNYTFKFDKSQPLGMIAPIWEAFPQPTLPGVTSMLLEFSPSYDQTRLVKELMDLDTRMLIFLQKLREINVRIHTAECEPWRTSLKKSEKVTGSESMILLTQDSKAFAYTFSKHIASNMPADPKREGQTTSEILLAFPIVNKQSKELECQQVYAFLPIRDYGFKFLLQGDFLLSASREDILSDSPWNKALRSCFVNAFVTLIKNSHESFLRYDWPLFLPVQSSPHDFFESARTSIIQRLRQDLVVKNSLSRSLTPRELMQIPEEFRTKVGPPLLAFESTSTLFLSDQYSKHCLEPLEKLGVRKMGLNDFVETLREVLKTDKATFRQQPNRWHSEFARKLLAALWKSDADKSQWRIVRELPIVPLEKDEWISPAQATEMGAFLPPDSDEELQLEGIDIKLVPREAASDQPRASLYKHLGIPTINQLEICHYIARSLCRERPLPQTISGDKIVSQTIFLFKAGWRNPSGQDMWFQNEASGFNRGSRLYVKSSSKYSASRYFGSTKELFLSEKYLDTVRKSSIDADGFQSWLEDCMHVWEIPRLLTVTTAPDMPPQIEMSWELSQLGLEMSKPAWSDDQSLINNNPSWIYLLRDNFRKYSAFFDLEEMLKNKLYGHKLGQSVGLTSTYQKFVESIGKLKVDCIGHRWMELNATYLPHPGVKKDAERYVPLVNVSDPEHPDWHYLKRFGLGVEPDLKMYLRCLENLSLAPWGSLSETEADKRVARYLDQIQARHTEDTNMVKQHFKHKPIIRVPPINSVSSHRWVKSSNCLWDGGKCFRILPVLKRQYPGNETLFSKVLRCGVATLRDLYQEATVFRLKDDLEHITDIFDEIEERLRNEEADPDNYFGRFASNEIFPIHSGDWTTSSGSGYDKLCKVKPNIEWFIADRENLRQSFKNLLPLLAFRVGTIQHLKKTMGRMKLDRYRLSRCAQSRADTHGAPVFDRSLSEDTVRRIPYILRLIPITIPVKTKRRIARHLRSLKVFLVDKLTQRWSVTVEDGRVVQGRPYPANVVFVIKSDETLRIFLSRPYLARSVCKNDIVQHFADFCEIRDNTHFLNMALWESLEEVKATFQDYGIPDYDPLIDSEDPLDEDDDGIDDVAPEPNKYDLQSTAISDGQEPEGVAESIQGYGESTQNNRRRRRSRRSGRKRPTAGAGELHHSDHATTGRSVCPHCTRDHVKFAEIGIHSVFGIRVSEGDKNQATQLPNLQPQTSEGFPGFIEILGSSSQTTADIEISTCTYTDDSDLQYKGEHFFSTVLAQYLGESYRPGRNWTSVLRRRAGHKRFKGSSATHASFTLPDDTGTVTAVMLREHPDLARLWVTDPPTWHFEVKTTVGKLDAPFYLTNAQVERARAQSITSPTGANQIPKHICVLVRVFNVGTSDAPEAHLYRDLWDMFLTGNIIIKADTLYRCGIRQASDDSETSDDDTAPSPGGGSGGKAPLDEQLDDLKPPPPYWSEKDMAKG